MLRDMEELLNTIIDEEIKEYMTEALSCYNAHSYKACIILSLISGMYGLHNRIKALAPTLQSAKELDDFIQDKIKNQKQYERDMVEQCDLEKIGLLSPSEKGTLLTYIDIRNRCAHPNNHTSSAEEARAVYTGIIDIVLSKPALLGSSYKKVLNNNLKDTLFFPQDTPEVYQLVTEQIYKNIHKSAIKPIVKSLVSIIVDENNSDEIQKKNTIILFAYLLKFVDIEVNSIIEPIVNNSLHPIYLFKIVEHNALLINKLSEISRIKFVRKVCDYIHNGRDEYSLKTLIDEIFMVQNILTRDESISILQEIIKSHKPQGIAQLLQLIENRKLQDNELFIIKELISHEIRQINVNDNKEQISIWVNILLPLDDDKAKRVFFEKLLEIVNHNDFYISNYGVATLVALNDELRNSINDDMKIKFVVAIIYSTGSGAREAAKVLDNGFQELNTFLQPFIENLSSSSDNFNKILYDVRYVGKLIRLILRANMISCIDDILEKILMGELYFNNIVILQNFTFSFRENHLIHYNDKLDEIETNSSSYIVQES